MALSSSRGCETDGFSVLQEGIHRRHSDTSLYCQDFDPDQRDPRPYIDHDPLIEDAIHHLRNLCLEAASFRMPISHENLGT